MTVRSFTFTPDDGVGVTGLAVGARVEIDWTCWRADGWGR